MTTTPHPELREALSLIKSTTDTIIKRARRDYIIALEIMIQRYQHQMWSVTKSYSSKLRGDVNNSSHMHPTVVNLIGDLTRIGESYLAQAADVGYERALQDLHRYGWIKGYTTPVTAPRGTAESAIGENRKYLEDSLLPDFAAKLENVKSGDDVPQVIAAFRGRIRLYGHYVWRTAERSYTLALKDFTAFYGTKMREAGPVDEPRDDHGRWSGGGVSDLGLSKDEFNKKNGLERDVPTWGNVQDWLDSNKRTTTAWYKNEQIMLPASWLSELPGVSHPNIGQTNPHVLDYAEQMKKLGGYKAFRDQYTGINKDITLEVNHNGVPKIYEGNARANAAFVAGEKAVPVRIVFVGGGETKWNPTEIPSRYYRDLREGGPGSGNYGHAGRPGEVGGSVGGGAVAKDGSNAPQTAAAGHVQTAANEIGVDPNGPAPWDMKADAPPRYEGDTSIFSPALPDANGKYVLGRRLQGTALNQPNDPNQVAMYTFIPESASTEQLKSLEHDMITHSDHAQLHDGMIGHVVNGQLEKIPGHNYWVRGDYQDLGKLADELGPKLEANFGKDKAYLTMMTDRTPGGTIISKGEPMEHMRVVVPFAAGTPKNTVGEPALSQDVRDKILTVMSGPEGRMVWQHPDFNGIHIATTTTKDVIDKLYPVVRALGASEDAAEKAEHGGPPKTIVHHGDLGNAGATKFIPTDINLERYPVKGYKGE